MGATVQTGTMSMADDAAYRALWVLFETALDAAGLTQTADTGQADSATVTKPVASLTYKFQET